MAQINQSAMSPEQFEQWAELASIMGPLGDKERDIMRQQKYADMLRDTAAPEGRNPTGRVYVAANPLEFLGAGLDRYAGAKRGEQLAADRAGITGTMRDELAGLMNRKRAQGLVNSGVFSRGVSPMAQNNPDYFDPYGTDVG